MHRWQRRGDRGVTSHRSRGVVVWSLGAFGHAWYLLRTEFTMDLIWQDVRYGIRSLRNGPGLVALAVFSLALGIGANATIFSAVDVFMFRPLPYPDSDRLYRLYTTNDERGWSTVGFSAPDLIDQRSQSETMEIAGSNGTSFNLSGDGVPERLIGMGVTPNFFEVLGVSPVLGRGFSRDEGTPGNNNVVILSDGFWQRRFGGDPSIVARTIQLDGRAHAIVGIMPRGFWFGTRGNDVWTPLAFTGEEARNSYYLEAWGRVRDGFSAERATTEIQQAARHISEQYPETSAGNGARLLSLHAYLFDENFRVGATIASVAVAFVLLIACANVANLLLTRAAGRGREVALRGALGAGRSRIARQFLVESFVIAALGGILGIVLSVGGIRGLVSWMPDWFPRVNEIGLDGRVLLYVVIVSGLTGIIFGMAPALQSSKPDLTDTLKEGGRAGISSHGNRLRRGLVIGEISLALVLLVSSTLLVQGFNRIRNADMGFDASDVFSMRVTLPETVYPDTTHVAQFWTSLRSRLQSTAGAVSVGATTILPLHGGSGTYYGISADELSESRRRVTNFRAVLPGYFGTMDIPIVQGRDITDADHIGSTKAAVVNSAFAERHWPDGDALGKQVFFSSGPREIVGIVENTLDQGADDSVEPMVYLAVQQGMYRSLSWVVETSIDPATFQTVAQNAMQDIDPTLPAYDTTPFSAAIEEVLGGDAIMSKIMVVLAGIALALAVGGVYGVMAYTVSQRTHEMGIRLALGAKHRDVIRLVVRQGIVLSLIGITIGLGIGAVVTRSLSTFLFGVSPFDPKAFLGVTVVLLLAAVTASYFPARRATRVDPITALRSEI